MQYLNVPKRKLYLFAKESNEIEGIHDKQRHKDHAASLSWLLNKDDLTVSVLEEFVHGVAWGSPLRTLPNHIVRVGMHVPPPPHISQVQLKELLEKVVKSPMYARELAWETHVEYERIHPFMDGNGRSGRAIWLWIMVRGLNWGFRYSFLHEYYYQTLSYSKGRDHRV